MGDIWNPFDANNPVYAKVAKDLKSTRRRVRATFLIAGTLSAAYLMRRQGFASDNKGIAGIGRVRSNQFGAVTRK
jgi:hypothetical protein